MEEEQEVKQTKSLEEEQRERKRHLIIIIILLFIAAIALTIAFTNITGELAERVTPTPTTPPTPPVKAEWNVGFYTEEVKGISSNVSSGSINCGTVTVTKTNATISNISLPGGSGRCSYPIKMENKGTIDAKVQEIILNAPNGVNCNIKGGSMTCGHISYKISSDQYGKNILQEGTELQIDSDIVAYLVVEVAISNSEFREITQSGAKITIIYSEI